MTVGSRIKEYAEMVKFEHSIFALPFALCGMLLAAPGEWPQKETYLWVILAMIGGRTAAMSLNRIIDRKIDKENPRTKNRAIPAGRIKTSKAMILTLISLIIMIIAVFQLPLICIYLLPVAVFIVIIYSYTKRFTIFSHFVLGFVLGAAAIGGWLAVSGKITLASILWGAAITLWVAGFDVIYSTQDIDFDRDHQLHSIPARFGLAKGIFISRLCHLMTVIFLISVAVLTSTGVVFSIGILFIALMLFYEQSLISAKDLSKVNMAFFNINGLISISFLMFTIVDKLIG